MDLDYFVVHILLHDQVELGSFVLLLLYYLSVTMADLSLRKACRGCKELMHSKDKHPFCLMCLTTTHESGECVHCKKICYAVYSCRLGLVGDTITNSRWPDGWRATLLEEETRVWGSNQVEENDRGSPDSCHEDEQDIQDEDTSGAGLNVWKASMENSIAGLGSSIQKISESLELYTQQQTSYWEKEESKGNCS